MAGSEGGGAEIILLNRLKLLKFACPGCFGEWYIFLKLAV